MTVRHWVTLGMVYFSCSTAIAQTSSYALIIGNNAPPAGHRGALSTLQYADDDAVRYFWFFKQVTDAMCLLTVPDRRTQSRYPEIAALAWPPSIDNLKRATSELSKLIAADRKAGKKTVVYIAFSGHGAVSDDGEPFLALSDGALTQKVFFNEVIKELKADYHHVFIDACYAEGIVGIRSLFGQERNGRVAALTKEEIEFAANSQRMDDYPGLGVIVSSTENEESHEWSRIESGVFTHELLSGLTGSADVNADGKIEYSELAAFIAAANREVEDLRGKLNVIAKPPKRNHNVPLIELSRLDRVAYLTGNPSGLGHFYIELRNGVRYLDANLGGLSQVRIAIPHRAKAYLRAGNWVAELKVGADNKIELAQLELTRSRVRRRGSIESALKEGFFATAFGPTYYKGFVDASNLVSVRFDLPRIDLHGKQERTPFPYQKSLAVASLVVSGALLVTAGIFGTLALQARSEFQNTKLERKSHDAANRYERYGNATWITAAVAPVAGLAAFLLWPDEPEILTVSVGPGQLGSGSWGAEIALEKRF